MQIPLPPLPEVLEPIPKLEHAGAVECWGGDAAFEQLCDPYASRVFENGGDYVVRYETSDSTDSVHSPPPSMESSSLDEYLNLHHDAAAPSSFSLDEYTSSGKLS